MKGKHLLQVARKTIISTENTFFLPRVLHYLKLYEKVTVTV